MAHTRCTGGAVVARDLTRLLHGDLPVCTADLARAQASFKPDRLIKETIRIAISALFYGAGCAFLSGALLRSDQRRSMAIGWRSRISNKP